MYLDFFKLNELPFTLTPNTEFYCDLASHQAALNVLLISLNSGEGFIKIVGEVGSGKTLLCRKLLNTLSNDDFISAYVPNPDTTPYGLRRMLAFELGLDVAGERDQNIVLDKIYQRLLAINESGKRVVLLIDEAQALSEECLEAVRLLTNLETETSKLIQVVLFAQPELDVRLNQPSLRQLKQRICFSYQLTPISENELSDYISHRLARAGHTYGRVFTQKACRLVYQASEGLPRVINILCHKSLMVAYGRGEHVVDERAVKLAINDSRHGKKRFEGMQRALWWLVVAGAGVVVATKYFIVAGVWR